jgi:hypothetical protein
MKTVVLQVAKATLGTRVGKIRPMLPQHSTSFQSLAAYIRLLRVVRREIWDRQVTVLPASSVGYGIGIIRHFLRRLWHRDKEAFLEGTAFGALGVLAGDESWSRRAAAGLRAHLHHADEEVRRLRRSEMKVESDKRRQAAIDSFWTGGGLRRLNPPSPSFKVPCTRRYYAHRCPPP